MLNLAPQNTTKHRKIQNFRWRGHCLFRLPPPRRFWRLHLY